MMIIFSKKQNYIKVFVNKKKMEYIKH